MDTMLLNRSGGRLAYVVVPLKGSLDREVVTFKRTKCGTDKQGHPIYTNEMVREMRKEPAGYMVYFPRGHVVRFRTKEDLAHHNLRLDGGPQLVDVRGLADPRT